MKLLDFAKNTYSQFGEDGIVEEIFHHIKPTSKVCVEFGAWDGIYLSNTAHLWKDQNWKAILVEADEERAKGLIHSNVIGINAKVGFDNNKDSIDFILKSNNIDDVDFMSVDIDGNDYYILQNLQSRPKVICIEYNPTIPFWIDCYQKHDEQFGASLAAINRVAKEKQYLLVAMTDSNAIFVDEQYEENFSDFDIHLPNIACYRHYISTITSYNGKHMLVGSPPYGIAEPILNDQIIFYGAK